jgi:casein kinase II subunit beta
MSQAPDTFKNPMKHSVMTDTDSSEDIHKLRRSWLDSFLEQPSSDWFCRVPIAFASDGFNTYGLRIEQAHVKSAFHQLLGSTGDDSDSFDSDSEDEVEKCTESIFGLIHARYIFTVEGLAEMHEKWRAGAFGECQRCLCQNEHLLPVGMTDRPGVDTVKLYCPKCRQLYEADEQHAMLDGAYFSKSFPHYFLLEVKRMGSPNPLDRQPSVDMYGNLTSESQSMGKIFK